MRELIRKVQVMRKDADFAVEQRIKASFVCEDKEGEEAIKEYAEKIKTDILCVAIEKDIVSKVEEKADIAGHIVTIKLVTVD